MRRQTGATEPRPAALDASVAPFAAALGHQLRRAREDAQQTGEQVAAHARLLGLGWDRSTLTRIELGQRQLTAAELLTIPLLFGRPLAALLPREAVRLSAGVEARAGALAHALTRPPNLRHGWRLPIVQDAIRAGTPALRRSAQAAEDRFPGVDAVTLGAAASEGWVDETTAKAARRLSVDRADVAVASHWRWSRGLAAERDARLDASGGGATPRARQARRGHITRTLLEELRPVLDTIRSNRERHSHGER